LYRRALAVVAVVAASIVVAPTVDAYPGSCSVAYSRIQAIALCTSGSGIYRVKAYARYFTGGGRYVYGPWVNIGKGSVVNAPSGTYIAFGLVQR
jgi:hypothetical protein